MSTEPASSETSIIHRKAKVARDGFDAREMSPVKALRLALAKAADTEFGLAVTVRTVEQDALPHAKIEPMAGEESLLILLDGAEQVRGVAILDIQLVAALIEVQLMGRVEQREAAFRPYTRTDAAITQPLLNTMLERFDTTLQNAVVEECTHGLRFGDKVEDARSLALALGAPVFDHFRLTLDLGSGAKTGQLDLLLPKRPAKRGSPQSEGELSLSARIEENALNAPVTLNATLGRMHLPLDEVSAWKRGTVLPLGRSAFNEARLLGACGHLVSAVKLGQLHGFRAVRIQGTESAAPAYDAPMAQDRGNALPSDVDIVTEVRAARGASPETDTGTVPTMQEAFDGQVTPQGQSIAEAETGGSDVQITQVPKVNALAD